MEWRLYRTRKNTFLAIGFEAEHKAVLERAVIVTAGRLFLADSPRRTLPTTRHLALSAHVYDRTIQNTALMFRAGRRHTVSEYTP